VRKRTLGIVSLGLGAAALLWRSPSVPSTHELPQFASQAPDAEWATPHRLVVDFRDDESHEQIAKLGASLGVTFHPVSRFVDVDEIYTVDTNAPETLIGALRADPDVEAADFDLQYRIPEESTLLADEAPSTRTPEVEERGFPNDPKYKLQWHLDQIHMGSAWKGAQGDGVIVAVIDTGVAKVPDLEKTELVAGYNFVSNSPDATDDHGHGTHVAGTIAQSTNNGIGVAGIAFHAKIMPIKVLSARGSGSVSGIAEGIRFAADHGAKVINMSLGGPMASQVLAKAVKYAHDKGVTVVCAAGNDGRGKVSYPAAYPGAIAVAATQFDETTTFYSNWGHEIDVAAPGGNTRVDQNGDGFPDGVLQNTVVPGDTSRSDYLFFMGTSMASPHVAGVAALIVSQGTTDPDAVEKVLKESARPPKGSADLRGLRGPENRYGAGILDAAQAVKKTQLGEGTTELGLGLLATMVVGLLLRRRGLGSLRALGLSGFVAMVVGACGLFFLPQIGLGGLPGMMLLSHGLPAWDLVAGASAHGNPLFYSAIIPLFLTALLYGKKRLRGVLAGLALGVGAHLVSHALFRTSDVKWVPDFLDSAWLGLNALLCFGTAHLILRK
jgi:serine protease